MTCHLRMVGMPDKDDALGSHDSGIGGILPSALILKEVMLK